MTLSVLSLTVIFAKLFTVLQVADAQSSSAKCDAQFNWMSNSRGQNPCLVAAFMQGACTGGDFTVAPLPLNTHYIGPTAEQANGCQCSTVTYSLVSACGLCQSRTIENWSGWSFNCTTLHLQSFPENLPSGTSVPAWAYLDVGQGDTFNAVAARAVSGAPESSALANQPTGTVASSTSVTFSSPVYTPPVFDPSTITRPASSNTAPTKKSNVGAIAGGAVGGVIVLGLIAGLVAFFVARKRNAIKSTSRADSYGHALLSSPPPMSQQHTMYGSNPAHNDDSAHVDNPAYGERPPRVYDPSDPSTYPQSPPTPTIHTTNSGLAPHLHGPQGHYSGVPEL